MFQAFGHAQEQWYPGHDSKHIASELGARVTVVEFNPSGLFAGSYLAVGFDTGVVQVWDTLSRRTLWTGHVHKAKVTSIQ